MSHHTRPSKGRRKQASYIPDAGEAARLAEENFALKLRLQELLPLLSSVPQRPSPPTSGAPPKKKQRGITNVTSLQAALRDHLVGDDSGKTLSQRKCCAKYVGLSKTQLGNHAKELSDKLKKSPQLRVHNLIAAVEVGKVGGLYAYFTPDEEKWMVETLTLRDARGFGLNRRHVCTWAHSLCKKLGLHTTMCGRSWYRGFMKRARAYKPNFGESSRSKLDVLRAAKCCGEVFERYFSKVKAVYKYHYDRNEFRHQ
jgi:hypothetical protein